MPSATPSRWREGNLTIALIDYGAGNLRSVHNALLAAGAQDVAVTADPDIVAKADRIVLPGVGAFAACMNGLSAISGLVEAMERRVRRARAPLFGIRDRQLGTEHRWTPLQHWHSVCPHSRE